MCKDTKMRQATAIATVNDVAEKRRRENVRSDDSALVGSRADGTRAITITEASP